MGDTLGLILGFCNMGKISQTVEMKSNQITD